MAQVTAVTGSFSISEICIAWGFGQNFRHVSIPLKSSVGGERFEELKKQIEFYGDGLVAEITEGSTVLGVLLSAAPGQYELQRICDVFTNVARHVLGCELRDLNVPEVP